MRGTADLHIHSTASDGILPPNRIMELCEQKGISKIAITDHDTIQGVKDLEGINDKYHIELIPGVEISSDFKYEEVHILGLFINPFEFQLNDSLKKLVDSRMNRAELMVKRLRKLGIDINIHAVLNKAEGDTIGRPHIAKVLVEWGYVSNPQEAFEKYLNSDRPGYVQRHKFSIEDTIALIKAAGGVSIWAHPGLSKKQTEIFSALLQMGVDGIEAIHPYQGATETKYWKNIADKYNLVVSGGSDYHDNNTPPESLGEVTVPIPWVENIRKKSMRTLD